MMKLKPIIFQFSSEVSNGVNSGSMDKIAEQEGGEHF